MTPQDRLWLAAVLVLVVAGTLLVIVGATGPAR